MRPRIAFMASLLLLAWVVPAAAFWPFTTTVPPAPVDSALAAARFDAWKKGPQATPTPAPGSATGAGATDKVVPGQTYRTSLGSQGQPGASGTADSSGAKTDLMTALVRRAREQRADSLAAQSLSDSLHAVIGDSLVAPANLDSTAAQTPPPAAGLRSTPDKDAIAKYAADRASIERGFAPGLTSTLGQTNDAMRMNTDLVADFTDPSGISLRSTLNYGNDINFNQNTDQTSKGLILDLNMPLHRRGLGIGLSTANNRIDSKQVTIRGATTKNAIDTRSGQLFATFSRRLDRLPLPGGARVYLNGLSVNAGYARRIAARENTTVALEGPGSGETRHRDTGDAYGAGLVFDRMRWVTMSGRLGRSKRTNHDQLTLEGEEFESKSQGDTASVDLNIPARGQIKSVTVSLNRVNGVDTTLEPARTSTGSQSGQVGAYQLETHATVRNGLTFAAQVSPARKWDVTTSFDASNNSDDYVIRRDQVNKTQRLGGKLDSKLNFWSGAMLTTTLELNRSTIDQDLPTRLSPSSRRDDGQKIYLELMKNLTKTLSIKTYGEVQLDQAFYDHEGPQGKGDRDELRQRVGIEFAGALSDSSRATVTAYVRTYDQAFIDPRRSAQSRNETEYVLRPGYTWYVNRRLTVRQAFGLASKVIAQVFDAQGRPDTQHNNDTLNRNHFMKTDMDYQLTSRASVNASYDYTLQDNGRYFFANGGRGFSPTVRSKRDAIGVGFRYAIIDGGRLNFTSRQESSRLYNYRFRGIEPIPNGVTESGNLALGFESKLDVRGLNLNCRAQRNRSFNSFLNRQVFYNVDATVTYTF